jgi:type VI secretion system secreted protein VgrG
MNLDIQTTVRTIFIMLLIAAGVLVFMAVRIFREAGRLRFFLKKRALLGRGWQLIFIAILVVVVAFVINGYAEPVTYKIFEPSPTATLTPTITQTPTVTQTPTSTQTPTVTPTLEFTVTPAMPLIISQEFTSQVTPNPNAVFSTLSFARSLTEDYLPIDPAETFENPVQTIYASFSYDSMSIGTQWTAMWYRDGELIYYETKPWNGASGGYGYSDCTLPGEDWLPGNYEVQMFIGEQWKVTGTFAITGTAPTPTMTPTLTSTITSTPEPSATITPTAPGTAVPSATLTATAQPSQTTQPTATNAPTSTLTPTKSPTPTLVPTATRRSTIYR